MSLINDASLILTPNAVKEGKLYSVIPSNGNGDMTVVRETATATRTNELGLIELTPYNLFSYSENFSNAIYSKIGNSVSADTTISPNGSLTADSIIENSASTTQHRLSTGISLTNGVTYTISAYVKRGVGVRNAQFGASGVGAWIRVYFDLTNGTVGSQIGGTGTITNVGNGWYRITATGVCDVAGINTFYLANTNGTTLGSETYNGDGVSSVIWWGSQLVQGSVPKDYFYTTDRLNVPRLNYDGGCPSILVEPQRTNRLLNSDVVVTQSITTAGLQMAVSFYGTGTITFSGTFVGSLVGTGVNNRVSIVFTPTTGTLVLTVTGSVTKGQVETGAYATSYIPTLGTSVTRNADIISRSNIFTNNLITSAGGTWFIELNNNLLLTRDAIGNGIWVGDNNTSSTIGNSLNIRHNGLTTRLIINKCINGTLTPLYTTLTNTIKIAIDWNGTTADVFVNSVKVVTGTAFTTTNMEFLNSSAVDVQKYIKSMMLFPRPLTDTEMSNLTTL